MSRYIPDHPVDMPEERLLRLAAQGNKYAFGQLYERYLDEIFRFVFYKIGDHAEAEDITENIFIKAWENLPKNYQDGDKIKNFRAWIYRIARNTTIDFYRKKNTLPLDTLQVISSEKSPEVLFQQTTLSHQLANAIKNLKPKLQEVIILRFVNNISHNQTANIMGITPGHTRVLQHRALKELRTLLESQMIHTQEETEDVSQTNS